MQKRACAYYKYEIENYAQNLTRGEKDVKCVKVAEVCTLRVKNLKYRYVVYCTLYIIQCCIYTRYTLKLYLYCRIYISTSRSLRFRRVIILRPNNCGLCAHLHNTPHTGAISFRFSSRYIYIVDDVY